MRLAADRENDLISKGLARHLLRSALKMESTSYDRMSLRAPKCLSRTLSLVAAIVSLIITLIVTVFVARSSPLSSLLSH